jgi:hypothetical protein
MAKIGSGASIVRTKYCNYSIRGVQQFTFVGGKTATSTRSWRAFGKSLTEQGLTSDCGPIQNLASGSFGRASGPVPP